MFWLIILGPLVILFAAAIYIDKKRGGSEELNLDNHNLQQVSKNEYFNVSGGDSHGNS